MELIYYTVAALLLYVASDYILNTIEIKLGKRLPNRSLVFFIIILVLAMSAFGVIQTIVQGPEPVQKIVGAQGMQSTKEAISSTPLQSPPSPTQSGNSQTPEQSQILLPRTEIVSPIKE